MAPLVLPKADAQADLRDRYRQTLREGIDYGTKVLTELESLLRQSPLQHAPALQRPLSPLPTPPPRQYTPEELVRGTIDPWQKQVSDAMQLTGEAGGAMLGGLTAPVTGPIGPAVGAGLGQYAAYRAAQALGLEKGTPTVTPQTWYDWALLGAPMLPYLPAMGKGLVAKAQQAVQEVAHGLPRGMTGELAGGWGNLGPVPVAKGQVLPETVVRRRLYHGTQRQYPDFTMEEASETSLYGPGIYMTDNARIAGGDPEQGFRGYAGTLAERQQRLARLEEQMGPWRDKAAYARTQLKLMQGQVAQEPDAAVQARLRARMEQYQSDLDDALDKLLDAQAWQQRAEREGSNVRPVYADLRNPFDVEQPIGATLAHAVRALDPERLTGIVTPQMRGEILFRDAPLSSPAASKETLVGLLQQAGYDGITHIGGRLTGQPPHRVYIAFTPETVYPAANVEATMEQLRTGTPE